MPLSPKSLPMRGCPRSEELADASPPERGRPALDSEPGNGLQRVEALEVCWNGPREMFLQGSRESVQQAVGVVDITVTAHVGQQPKVPSVIAEFNE